MENPPRSALSIVFLFIASLALAQTTGTARVTGVLLDEFDIPLEGVNVQAFVGEKREAATSSDATGFYEINIPANREVKLVFSYTGRGSVTQNFSLEAGSLREFYPRLDLTAEQIGVVVLRNNTRARAEGIITIDPEDARLLTGASAGVENLLKSLPGVSGNNELSTAYSVRGGNYDENLVYVNGVEVYRPFLVRSGQQEGLSFVNTDLVRKVSFSAGGWQAKYGDKLSSVLDIEYRQPTDFGAGVEISGLGASAFVEGNSKNDKFKAILGLRYRDNSLLVNSTQVESNYQPLFADAQTFLNYQFNDQWAVSFLGNLSINRYDFEPQRRQTNFGTLQEPIALLIVYDGQEEDQYETYFGAVRTSFQPTDDLELDLTVSTYQTQEQEYYDIQANYALGQPNTDIGGDSLGDVEFTEGIGSQLEHGRNNLDAIIASIKHTGTWDNDGDQLAWGIKYQREDIRDRIREYEVIDSAGFAIRPPGSGLNDQPYTPFDGPLVPFTSTRADNDVQVDRLTAYAQYSLRTEWGSNDVWINGGVRSHSWTVSGDGIQSTSQTVFSPRASIALQPDWEQDMIFRLSGGYYYQPPFYRELRNQAGDVVPDVKAQQSIHAVLGHDWSFKMWNRPFKLSTEAYYKDLQDVNPYTIENVRIRYQADNSAVAYAYGLDMRLNGEFVPGTESWVSFGYLKTEENINDRGFIARPTDQRLKFAAVFQDYVPAIPKLQLNINLVYNTGLPGGSPSYADKYDFQSRLPDYRRVDAGFSYVFVDRVNPAKEGSWLANFDRVAIGFEIFNLFDNQNSLTNTWVRDVYTQRQFAVPNFLTSRVFNLRLSARL